MMAESTPQTFRAFDTFIKIILANYNLLIYIVVMLFSEYIIPILVP